MSKQRQGIARDIYAILHAKYAAGRGQDRHADKKTGDDVRRIYSTRTYQTYRQQGKAFAAYAKAHGCKTLDQAREVVPGYLQSLIDEGKSGYSVRTAASAIGKVYGVDYNSFGIEMPERKRSEIKNNRGQSKMIASGHISEETAEKYASILRCIGLRRSEALLARGTDLIEKDGSYYIHVPRGKGGKERTAIIQGTAAEIEAVVQKFKEAGKGRVWPAGIPKDVPIHRYRSQYAERVYRACARPVEALQGHDRYFCRNDLKGLIYDRQALAYVSKQLGHSRVGVVAVNYLHGDLI